MGLKKKICFMGSILLFVKYSPQFIELAWFVW